MAQGIDGQVCDMEFIAALSTTQDHEVRNALLLTLHESYDESAAHLSTNECR